VYSQKERTAALGYEKLPKSNTISNTIRSIKMENQNPFITYLSKVYDERELKEMDLSPSKAGSFITISREYGCFAIDIAEKLIHKINESKNPRRPWSLVSKEILEQSSKELHANMEKIGHIFEGKKRGFMNELSSSFVKNYYVSDTKIINTIKKIIQAYAWHGNVIIVGRGGAVLTHHFPKSIHIKLHAPYDFRVRRIADKMNLPKHLAMTEITDVDHKRNAFIQFFLNGKNEMDFYDLTINRSDFEEDDVVELIYRTAELKGVFK
jgi:cytidylate kinase